MSKTAYTPSASFSRHNTLDKENSVEVLEAAVASHGAPEIINSDQALPLLKILIGEDNLSLDAQCVFN